MADEKLSLLFRRGTIDLILAGDKIVPGAVSFCTDEPGIYLDLTAAEGGGTAKRVRVGDFITVASFDDIKATAAAATDPDKAFSEHCLYYSIKENALMKYNKTEKTFILINDLTEVKSNIGTLSDKNIANEGNIKTLTTDLAAEVERATNAEAALSDRIDALNGGDGSGNSLSELRKDLTDEISARESGDKALAGNITALDGRITVNENDISSLKTLIGELPDEVATNIVAYINAKVLEELNRATGIENGLRTDVDKNIGDISSLSGALTGEIARAKTAEEANETAAANAQAKADEAAAAASAEKERAMDVEDELRELIIEFTDAYATDKDAFEQSISGLTGNLTTATNTANEAKALAETNKSNLDQEVLDRQGAFDSLNSEIQALIKRDGELTSLINAESQNRTNAIADALTEAANTADQKDQALLALINQNMAAANAMTFKGEVTGYDSLPASGILAGDTYIVTASFGKTDHDPQRGDLLVASADQAEDDVLADAIAKEDFFIWVKTGYSTFNDPELIVEDAIIKIKSHLGEVLGTIAIVSTSENIVTSISGDGKESTINVNFVWGTF